MDPIINIDPIEQSRAAQERTASPGAPAPKSARAQTVSAGTPAPDAFPGAPATGSSYDMSAQSGKGYYTFNDAQHGDATPFTAAGWKAGAQANPSRPTYVKAQVIGDDAPGKQGGSRLGGLAQMAVGGAVALVGVPMLILPGPGLLAIAGGAALAIHGAKKAFRAKA